MKKSIIIIFLVLFLCPSLYAEKWSGPTKKKQTKMKYFLHTGFTFDVVLKNAIYSFNSNTPVICQTEYDITFLGKIVIPKNTKIIGTSAIEKTDDRVNVKLHTIVFPNGQEIPFVGIALELDGSAGIKGKVKNMKKARLPVKILLSAAATGASVATESDIPSEMIKGIAEESKQELAQKQDYSISVKKDIAIQVYVVDRLEY